MDTKPCGELDGHKTLSKLVFSGPSLACSFYQSTSELVFSGHDPPWLVVSISLQVNLSSVDTTLPGL